MAKKTSSTPTPATVAINSGKSISLDLDVDDAPDEEEADGHHDSAGAEDEEAGRQAEQLGRLRSIGAMNVGAMTDSSTTSATGSRPTT